MNYHFGVPGSLIWTTHIIFGILFVYLGYLIQEGKSVHKLVGTALIVLGVTMALYHTHLWYYESKKDDREDFRGSPRRDRGQSYDVDEDESDEEYE